MTDNFKEIGSLFGREGAGAGFAKQTDKESFTYAFAWPEGDTWATLTGYLNLDEQPEEYVRRVLQDGGFRSDWGKSRVSLPARLLEGRGDGGFLHRSKRRYRSRGLRPRDRGEPVAHGWRDCPRGRVLHRYQ